MSRAPYQGVVLGCVAALTWVVAVMPRAACAQSRYPGLDGKYTGRHLTVAQNSLTVVGGPLMPMMMGQRVGAYVTEGGFAYGRRGLQGSLSGPDAKDTFSLTGGVAIGVLETLEVGVLFVPLQLAPSVQYGDLPIVVTYAQRVGQWDIGARLGAYIPSNSDAFRLNPGVPVSWHSDRVRIDTALYVPVDFEGQNTVGLNVPLRASWNVRPKIFVGAETALYDPSLKQGNNLVMPLGAFAGYTMVVGSKLVDLTASFMWDGLFWLDAPSGVDTVQTGTYRILFGFNYRTMLL
jgi:hypothetical protein